MRYTGDFNLASPLLFLLLLILFFPPKAHSEAITEQAILDFGTIALKDNSGAYTLRVRYTGQIINDPEIVIITPGTPAEYFLTGFPASTLLSISITSTSGAISSPFLGPSNEQFSLSNFDYLPSITSNADGEYLLYVGATITTSGSGTYADNLYVTTMTINISY